MLKILIFISLYIIISFISAFIGSLIFVYRIDVAHKLWLINSEEIDILMDFILDEISRMVNRISIDDIARISTASVDLHTTLRKTFSAIIFICPISVMAIYNNKEIFNRAFLRLLDERG